jgi:NAD(P)-dependent dehydrogenase (short-subunit alcohol dehydrogenase family)
MSVIDQKKQAWTNTAESLIDVTGNVAVITGGASGIGETIAYALSELGVNIGIIDLVDTGEHVAKKIRDAGGDAVFVRTNITNEDEVNQGFRVIAQHFGQINYLINNAGTASKTPFDLLSLTEWARILDVNLKGTFLCTKAALPYMRKSNDGKIVMISSGSAITGSGGSASYSASKGGINSLTRALARELAKENIRVNAVAPRTIRGRMLESVYTEEAIKDIESKLPLGRLGTERDVANTVIFLLCRLSNYITGETILVDGGRTFCGN